MIDVASGKRRVLLSVPGYDFENPRVSPDGRYIACLRERHATGHRPVDVTVVLLDAGAADAADASGPGRDLLAGWDRWPNGLAWAPDSSALYLTADDGGRCPVFRVDVGTGEVTRVTADDGAYTDLNPDPDGRYLYALRAAVDSPPTPVRIDLTTGPNPARSTAPASRSRCRAGSKRSRPPRRTASRSGPGSCCPRPPRRTSRRRSCSGCTAAR